MYVYNKKRKIFFLTNLICRNITVKIGYIINITVKIGNILGNIIANKCERHHKMSRDYILHVLNMPPTIQIIISTYFTDLNIHRDIQRDFIHVLLN